MVIWRIFRVSAEVDTWAPFTHETIPKKSEWHRLNVGKDAKDFSGLRF